MTLSLSLCTFQNLNRIDGDNFSDFEDLEDHVSLIHKLKSRYWKKILIYDKDTDVT